jgi:hypothetical protein
MWSSMPMENHGRTLRRPEPSEYGNQNLLKWTSNVQYLESLVKGG